MMSYRIDDGALKEIDAIIATIKEDNEYAAEKWSLELRKKFASLAAMPRMGRMRDDLIPDLYMFPFGNYLVFYDIEQAGIVIIHVADGRRDIPNLYP